MLNDPELITVTTPDELVYQLGCDICNPRLKFPGLVIYGQRGVRLFATIYSTNPQRFLTLRWLRKRYGTAIVFYFTDLTEGYTVHFEN